MSMSPPHSSRKFPVLTGHRRGEGEGRVRITNTEFILRQDHVTAWKGVRRIHRGDIVAVQLDHPQLLITRAQLTSSNMQASMPAPRVYHQKCKTEL